MITIRCEVLGKMPGLWQESQLIVTYVTCRVLLEGALAFCFVGVERCMQECGENQIS